MQWADPESAGAGSAGSAGGAGRSSSHLTSLTQSAAMFAAAKTRSRPILLPTCRKVWDWDLRRLGCVKMCVHHPNNQSAVCVQCRGGERILNVNCKPKSMQRCEEVSGPGELQLVNIRGWGGKILSNSLANF